MHREWVEEFDRVAEYREKDPRILAKRCSRRGITPEQFRPLQKTRRMLRYLKTKIELMDSAIDHNHNTGEFRGVLCKQCNRALGMFKDSSMILRNAVEYLEAFGSYGYKE